MQCPHCGYKADDTAVFCPGCRFQFQEVADTPADPDIAIAVASERGAVFDESSFGEALKKFSDKELKMLEIQLVQSAVLIVLIISLFIYTLIWTVPFVSITYAGLSFGVTGFVCLACGLIAGIVFFFYARRSLIKFRFR